jgi:hypothetical protein
MKATQSLPLLLVMLTGIDSEQSLRRREQSQSCGVIGFSLYSNSTSTITPIYEDTNCISNELRSRILLDSYVDGKINLIADVGESCDVSQPIQCVKIQLGDSIQRKENFAPYCLYGNNPNKTISTRRPQVTGWQKLQAWTYTDRNCTKGESGYRALSLHLVPNTIKTVKAVPLTAEYVNTNGTLFSEKDLSEVIDATCDYMDEFSGYGLVYKQSMRVTNFTCRASLVQDVNSSSYSRALLRYNVGVTFQMSPNLNEYLNDDMPTSSELIGYLANVLRSEWTRGPFDDEYLLNSIKTILPLTNPFHDTTEIRVI